MIKVLSKLKASSSQGLLGGILTMVTGTAAGQIIVILSSPLITRLYTPDEVGVLGVYVAFLSFFMMVSNFRYELAVPLPEKDEDSINIVALCLMVLLLFTLVTGLIFGLLGIEILTFTKSLELAPYLWLLPFGVFIGGLNNLFTYWALRKKNYKLVSFTRLSRGLGMTSGQLTLGYLKFGALGLVIGHVIGFAAGLISLIRFTWKSGKALIKYINPAAIKANAKRYKNFPLYSTGSDLMNVAGNQLPLVMFAGLFSPSVAGLYMMAHRVANAPAALLSEVIGKAFMRSAVDAKRDQTLPVLVERIYVLLLKIGLGPLLTIGVIAPEFFELIFGAGWKESGLYLQLLIPWLSSVVLFVPILTLFAVLELQKVDLKFQFILAVVRVSTLFIGAKLGGILLAISLYSFGAAVVYMFFGFWLISKSGVNLRKAALLTVKELFRVGAIVVILIMVKLLTVYQLFGNFGVSNYVLVVIGLLACFFMIWRIKPAMKEISSLG